MEAPRRSKPDSGRDAGEAARLARFVERIAGADESALAALYDTTSAWVHGLVARILRDRQMAEEVTLDVYLQVWRRASGYSEVRGSVTAWLTSIARSRAIDRLRAGAARQRLEKTFPEVPDPIESTSEAPEARHAAGERRAEVLGAVERLPPSQRRAIELAYFRGMTHQEISHHLRQPLGTIKTQIRLGVRKLRGYLHPSLLEPNG